MGTKLYVANLPAAPSAIALRAHFSTCGTVANVELMLDRNVGRGRGSAIVRMASAAGAERAISELNGSSFAGQFLIVEAAPDDPAERHGHGTRAAQASDGDSQARITLQFREPANMTYELDCEGVGLVVRVFFPTETGDFRVVAQASGGAAAPSSDSTATSRAEALRNIARTCREGDPAATLARINWIAVEQALTKVRAI
jgi:RNA recognition motif-containing protein